MNAADQPLVRAMVMEGPEQLVLREFSEPECPPGGAVIQVLANGICGSDYALLSGEMKNPGGQPPQFPMVPGHEPVGKILRIDPEAARRWGVEVGDRIVVEPKANCDECEGCVSGGPCQQPIVYSLRGLRHEPGLWGGFSERMCLLPGSRVFKVPPHVGDEDATMFNPLGNAFYWVDETAQVKPGERVLILGAGQRGLCCASAAAELGASSVIVTGLSQDAEKLALATKFGATDTVVVDQVDTVEEVRRLTEGHGVDVVIDTVPQAVIPLAHAVELLRRRGRLVLAGVREDTPSAFLLERFRVKELRMFGVSGATPTAVARAMEVISDGTYPFELLHSHVYGLSRAAEAINLLAPGERAEGPPPIHVVVKPGEL